MSIVVRRAVFSEAPRLTEIAHAAKRHWDYPEAWIQLWRDSLTFTPDFIREHAVYVAECDRQVVGVFALLHHDTQAEIEHLWVMPSHMGEGVGRRLLQQVLDLAGEWGVASIRIVSDPNAEAFYQHMGARRVGDVESSPDGRRLPVLELDL